MPVVFVCAAAACFLDGCASFRSAPVLVGSLRDARVRGPRRLFCYRSRSLLWAWKAGDGLFGLVDASIELESSFLLSSVSYRPLALIFLKNKDALDKRVALNSVHAQRAQPFPDSSTQHW